MSCSPPALIDETARLAALDALALLDTPPEAEFDAIARLASAATGCETAGLTLVDRERLWLKAGTGAAPPELPRRDTFCDAVIRGDAAIEVADVSEDPRFRDLPLVSAGARFYAGLPIRVADNDGDRHAVGTLCVIDDTVRSLTADQRKAFRDLATLAEALLAARRVAREAVGHATVLARQQRLFGQAERMAKIGWWRLNLADNRVEWSDGIFRIHELPGGTDPTLTQGLDFYPASSRAAVAQALAHTLESGEPFDVEADFVTARGQARRVRATGEIERQDGRAAAVIGVMRDMTEEHGLAMALRRSAETDPLTHMANRSAFTRRLDQGIDAARTTATPLGLVLIDLDGFKRINDTFGHLAGDEVLKAVARRLHAPWLAHCCAARLGGDEFAVIVDDPALLADETTLVSRLEAELQLSTDFDGLKLESGASIGLLRYDPARFADQRAFIKAADAQLYATKRRRVGDRRRAA